MFAGLQVAKSMLRNRSKAARSCVFQGQEFVHQIFVWRLVERLGYAAITERLNAVWGSTIRFAVMLHALRIRG